MLLLLGSLISGVVADVASDVQGFGVESSGTMVESFDGDADPTFSASTATALNPFVVAGRDYLAVLGILAASVFLSLRKRPHGLAEGGR